MMWDNTCKHFCNKEAKVDQYLVKPSVHNVEAGILVNTTACNDCEMRKNCNECDTLADTNTMFLAMCL